MIAALALGAGLSVAEPPAGPKPSEYAPAADLAAQIDYYFKRLDEALAAPADYDADKQGRVKKDANTVAAISLVLGQHDQPSKYQAASAAMIKAAQALAEASKDFAAAKEAFSALKGAAETKSEPIAWGEVASLPALMQQVPIVNNSLRRSLAPARFKKQAGQIAEQAATLAAIAQASWHDTSSAADDADAVAWRKFCDEMRDAAAGVNAAAHKLDQPAADAAAKKLAQSCDSCHAKFRQ
jgi:hypothetical protein